MHMAERLTALLQHRYVEGDTENNAILDALIGGIGDGLERVGIAAFGDEDAGIPAERALTDPRFAPLWALAHAALYTGAVLPGQLAGEADADYEVRARAVASNPTGPIRGSHEAVRRAAQPLLTGTKTVTIDDETGSYEVTVRVRTSEVVDLPTLREAIEGSFVSGGTRGALRAEQRLVLVVSDEPVINELEATIDSYSTDTIDTIGSP